MLTVYRSNRAEWLAEVLAAQLRLNKPKPFQSVEIMVNTWPTSRWLSEQIATFNGISALIEFPFPNSHLRKFVQLFLGLEVTSKDPWNTNQLTWEIIDVLPKLLKEEESKHLHEWIQKGSNNNKELDKRIWTLAKSIANTINEYILYRPDVIAQWWNLDSKPTKSLRDLPPHIKWQPLLLRLLKTKIKSEPICLQINEVVTRLKRKEHSSKELPRDLLIFGVSSLAPIQIELIQALSSVVNVQIFLLTPGQDLWKRCKSRREELGNDWKVPMDGMWMLKTPRIEASLGRMGSEFQQLLEGSGEYQLGEWQEKDLFSMPVKIATYNSKEPTFLEQLQESLVVNKASIQLHRKHKDNSLIFLESPGQRRQVQLIRDQIIQWLATDDTLQPRDIIIMTPQVKRLAPLISSVFNDISATNVNLPWKITDRSQIEKPGLIQFILEFIDIASSRLTALNLDRLLTNPALQNQFKLDQDEVDRITYCLYETGFRWGIDEKDRNGNSTHSLEWCLERWLLGIVLPNEPNFVEGDIAPFSSTFTVNEITKWWNLLSLLCKHLKALRNSRKSNQWVFQLKSIVTDLLENESNRTWEGELFNITIENWSQDSNDCILNIQPLVIKEILTELFSLENGRFGHRSGKITISALEPMRAIPHRVIVLMGLDELVFPRSEERPSFNLLEQKRLLGDPNNCDKDRYVLLEAIMSCRQHLLITWNSRDEKTGEKLEAPAPINQCIDYLKNELSESDQLGLVQSPPPNPLSNENFIATEYQQPISCDRRNLEARIFLDNFTKPKQTALGIPFRWEINYKFKESILTNDIVKSWLRAPQITWLEHLQLRSREKKISIETIDTFNLNELQRYQLLNEELFTQNNLESDNNVLPILLGADDWQKKLRGQGILPPKSAAELECEILEARIASLSSLIRDLGELEEKNLQINNENITYLIIQEDILVVEIGKLKSATIMSAWLQHLQVCLYDDKPRKTLIISRSTTKSSQHQYKLSAEFTPILKKDAMEMLQTIYMLVEQGLTECWPVPPQSGWELFKARYMKKTNSNNYFKKKWKGSFNQHGENHNSEMILCFGYDCDAELFLGNKIFENCLNILYQPILNNFTAR
ncbi:MULTISPECIES: exodeoxyribonuclease V subunit gamma [Prochlorococcus]|uniref:Exonuclease V gamma subunit n=1 Tax=Prochlorococcus marinus (strain SARG / CCMP1375 / SS120) TaxID=167539 RepID=Q7VBK2_PROMA|nr:MULTISPECIES: exodeoxyribonuclease V subunit gamma [Prochlorococcus]AAQ00135.1 Exonuclease V gamma subunit [Prochlorococcus marinus subsp. marinus str. CCMP1375]KGG23396.1 Exodeoxyribonuclease V gamma chain [Prochlorococcus marinus str. SS35]KGG32368.1 Exodeoxyribonuclease V gamma chain [Prochlorococcus marinus str. SS51]KGG37000.1 Exodeoxyribonuclease V gamma chain [Prochlorococcus sp. SS52]